MIAVAGLPAAAAAAAAAAAGPILGLLLLLEALNHEAPRRVERESSRCV